MTARHFFSSPAYQMQSDKQAQVIFRVDNAKQQIDNIAMSG